MRPVPEIPLAAFALRRAVALADKPALLDSASGRALSYGQLATSTRLVAASLAQHGFRPRDVLAIVGPTSPEYAVVFCAVAQLGGISLTLDPHAPPDALAEQASAAGASFMLTEPGRLAAMRAPARLALFAWGDDLPDTCGGMPLGSLLKSSGQVPQVWITPRVDVVLGWYAAPGQLRCLTHHAALRRVGQFQLQHRQALGQGEMVPTAAPFWEPAGLIDGLVLALSRGLTLVIGPPG